MRAWVVHQPGALAAGPPGAAGPLRLVERDVPEPGPGELLIRVLCCGVCRTDLQLAEGDLPPRRPDVTPGHEVAYACRLPAGFTDQQLAPLLCAGIIGYRALVRAQLPPGGVLGIWGFGGSAHLTAQVAVASGAAVHVFTRAPAARELALRLGAASAQDSFDHSPEPLDSAIIFAPVGDLVPAARRSLDRGGILAVAGIYLSQIPALDYAEDLFQERELRSVTANSRGDAEEFLRLAQRLRLQVSVPPYAFDRADQALADLAADRVTGAAVLSL